MKILTVLIFSLYNTINNIEKRENNWIKLENSITLTNIKSKETLRNSYLNPALENGLIRMTLPDKPNSKNQRYIKQ